MPPDAGDDMLEDRAHLRAARRLARAQDRRHQLAGCSLVNVNRQKAALVVMRIEQRKLLMAVHRVHRVVDVENDRSRPPRVAGAELVHHRPHHPRDLNA
jgi:chemotaxis signal transduction protein